MKSVDLTKQLLDLQTETCQAITTEFNRALARRRERPGTSGTLYTVSLHQNAGREGLEVLGGVGLTADGKVRATFRLGEGGIALDQLTMTELLSILRQLEADEYIL